MSGSWEPNLNRLAERTLEFSKQADMRKAIHARDIGAIIALLEAIPPAMYTQQDVRQLRSSSQSAVSTRFAKEEERLYLLREWDALLQFGRSLTLSLPASEPSTSTN